MKGFLMELMGFGRSFFRILKNSCNSVDLLHQVSNRLQVISVSSEKLLYMNEAMSSLSSSALTSYILKMLSIEQSIKNSSSRRVSFPSSLKSKR